MGTYKDNASNSFKRSKATSNPSSTCADPVVTCDGPPDEPNGKSPNKGSGFSACGTPSQVGGPAGVLPLKTKSSLPVRHKGEVRSQPSILGGHGSGRSNHGKSDQKGGPRPSEGHKDTGHAVRNADSRASKSNSGKGASIFQAITDPSQKVPHSHGQGDTDRPSRSDKDSRDKARSDSRKNSDRVSPSRTFEKPRDKASSKSHTSPHKSRSPVKSSGKARSVHRSPDQTRATEKSRTKARSDSHRDPDSSRPSLSAEKPRDTASTGDHTSPKPARDTEKPRD